MSTLINDWLLTLDAVEARGWRIVLLRELSKHPTGTTWQVTSDLGVIDRHIEMVGNIGLVAGQASGVAIADDDHSDLLRRAEAALGSLGERWVQTRRGAHVYLDWEPDLPAGLMFEGELIGELQRGGTVEAPCQQQVVMPPSLHPDTRQPYRWLVNPVTTPLRPLPDIWRQYLRKHGTKANTPITVNELEPSALAERHFIAMQQPGARRRAGGR